MQDRVAGFFKALADRLNTADPGSMGHVFETEREMLWLAVTMVNHRMPDQHINVIMDHFLIHGEDRLPGVRTDGVLVYVHREAVRLKWSEHIKMMDSAVDNASWGDAIPMVTAWSHAAIKPLVGESSSVCDVMTDVEHAVLSEEKHLPAVVRWRGSIARDCQRRCRESQCGLDSGWGPGYDELSTPPSKTSA